MSRRRTARQIEAVAARKPLRRSAPRPSPSEPLVALRRRGLDPRTSPPDVPFDPQVSGAQGDALVERLRHYAFRLFLRGAIQRPGGFAPAEATRYLDAEQATGMAEACAALGVVERLPRGRFRLVRRARSFGGTLEWWLGRELSLRLGFAVATGVRSGAPGVGGDLDVVAIGDGRLVYLEAKSSPPKHVTAVEVRAFLRRVRAVRPDVALFVVDTALRLSDKILPMFAAALSRPEAEPHAARRVFRDTWAVTPHVFVVNAREDLAENVCRAVVEGLRALAPPPP